MWMKVVCVVLAFSFIAAVFAYGTGKKYDAWYHFQVIVSTVREAPSLEQITQYWTQNEWEDTEVTYIEPVQGNGAGSSGGISVRTIVVRPNEVTKSDWGVFEPIQSFFGAVKGFFVRAYYTIKWVVDVIVFAFEMVAVIAPWNGYVKEV